MVGRLERVEGRVEEDPAGEGGALSVALTGTDGAIAVVGRVVTTARSAARGEVLTTLASRALGFGSGAGACVGAVRLRAAGTGGRRLLALMLRVPVQLALVALRRWFFVAVSRAKGRLNCDRLCDAPIRRDDVREREEEGGGSLLLVAEGFGVEPTYFLDDRRNDFDTSREWRPDVIDLFGDDATPEPLPLLETLVVRNQQRGFDTSQILQLLRLAPNLVNCMFDGMDLRDFEVPSESEKPILSSLRTLMFGSDGALNHDGGLLSCLLCPSLTGLSVRVRGSGHTVSRFFRQSAPLQELILGMVSCKPAELHECLYLILSLYRLELWYPGPDLVAEFFANLANSFSLLPNLGMLIIHPLSIPDSTWELVLRALSTRRFELHIDGHLVKEPPADVLAALEELVADGVEIRIGSDTSDFI
ncbi:hypothetical protein C8R45DRAFT_1088793 [Mycena sanguinolenta]|nr:hypothetical protein C8R45DRAFT_1088793 [Mycena sanguinolenta]